MPKGHLGGDHIRLIISESHQIVCELLCNALQRTRGFNVVGSAIGADQLCTAVRTEKPDIALVSTHLEDGPYSGFRVLSDLKQDPPQTKLVMLMDTADCDVVIDAFRAGVRGVFRKSEPVHQLQKCITAVHRGQIWANNWELEQIISAFVAANPLRCLNSRGKNLLSVREQEIIPLVAQGYTNREIAQRLNISEHTVKNHLFRMYEKLGISSRVELILYASSRRDATAA